MEMAPFYHFTMEAAPFYHFYHGGGPFLPLADVLALFSKAITETLGNEER